MKGAQFRSWALAAALIASVGCPERKTAEDTSPYARGELVYKNVCIVCHDHDPSKHGTVGPAIAGSSRELIEARVLHGSYPPNYQPKQPGRNMPQFPHLKGSIDDLATYLAEAGS